MKSGYKSLYGNLLLLITAIVWGSSFVAQETGTELVEPFTYQCARFFLGAVVLLPFIFLFGRKKENASSVEKPGRQDKKTFWKAALLCGVVLAIAANLQQLGIAGGTHAGKSGFITAFYMLIVPIFSLIIGKKVSPVVFPCVLVALGGLYLLCKGDGNALSLGDFFTLLCAVGFAFHIMIVSHYSPLVDGLKLSCAQFFIAGLISGIPMLLLETPTFSAVLSAWIPIGYSGVFSCGIAYTLQIIGQKYTSPTVASMIMSLESVFATLSGLIMLRTVPTGAEWLGMALMFLAIITVQLPFDEWAASRKKKTS